MTEITPIADNVREFLSLLPDGVELVAACKTRSSEEVQQAIDAGIGIIGENYVQEAEQTVNNVSGDIKWHLIGHLQSNKVKRAVKIFDMMESLDSLKLAKALNKECAKTSRVMDCLVEINSGREDHKYGILPEDAEKFLEKISSYENIKVKGLMTMGPLMGEPEEFRPYFKTTKEVFDRIKEAAIPNIEMRYLSMGMTDSYEIAIEEGANMVRIGTALFGPRR